MARGENPLSGVLRTGLFAGKPRPDFPVSGAEATAPKSGGRVQLKNPQRRRGGEGAAPGSPGLSPSGGTLPGAVGVAFETHRRLLLLSQGPLPSPAVRERAVAQRREGLPVFPC